MTPTDRWFSIGPREVGEGRPVFVIAELSANHNQDFDRAASIIEEAARAGADAVKLQTFTADTITFASDRPEFRVGEDTLWSGRTLHELYREAAMPWDWQPRLKSVAEDHGIQLFSTPFDHSAVEFLEEMGVPAFKVASFELVDLPLIRRIAGTGKPVIMSTGMATFEEIEDGVAAARDAGARDLALLKCTSAYPSPPEAMNLRTIPDMAGHFGVVVGLSDHTMGIAAPAAAVALGASIVEKHVTLSRSDPGPDSAFSLEPHELRAMIDAIRVSERALGEVSYAPTEKELESRRYRRSLFVVRNVSKGEVFNEANVRSIRPAAGLHTRHLEDVLGKRAAQAVEAGTPLSWDLVDGMGT